MGLVWYFSDKSRSLLSPTTSQGPAREQYTNAKGKKWGPLPEGVYAFQVTNSDKTEGPKFLEGKIDPLDVSVGDTQNMRVVVQDSVGIVSVTAEIETDKDTVVVPLKKTGIVTYENLMPERYAVQEGQLKILSKEDIELNYKQKILAEKDGLIKSVRAAGGDKEVWEGSWVVRDTHTTTYHTVFKAKNTAGQEKSLTMAWSDPCFANPPFGGNKNITSSCSFGAVGVGSYGAVDGWDGGNITLDPGVNVSSLETVGYFVWNPGKSITIGSNASFTLTSGHQLRQSCLYLTDGDLDGDALSSIRSYNDGCGTVSGKNRLQSIVSLSDCDDTRSDRDILRSGYRDADGDTYGGTYANNECYSAAEVGFTNTDCYDSNGSANPGQTGWFTTNRGDGSFDYNCSSGSIEYDETAVSYCQLAKAPDKNFLTLLKDSLIKKVAAVGEYGWIGGIPACGDSGPFNWSDSFCEGTGGTPYKTSACH